MQNFTNKLRIKSVFFKLVTLNFLLLNLSLSGFSQHDSLHHSSKKDTVPKFESGMNSFFSINMPMNRDGSGTGWQADQSPMWMYMKMKKKTTFMFHGSLFLRYTFQDIGNKSNRGGHQFDAPNMFMFAVSRKISQKDLFSLFTMISLEPLTEGNKGYPLLFQSGETYNDSALVDRQHPHDLFSSLAINWTHSFSKDLDLNCYFGFPGEPGLGPQFFMHRISAMNNPDAPLGHHWQDATHISFGVASLGFRYKFIKLEGSAFNGREPDENRYDFDTPYFDSYSYRVSMNPLSSLSLQFSQGFLKSPERLYPTENVIRSTASIIHTKRLQHNNFISSTALWGMNYSHENNFNSFLLESNLQLSPLALYMRYEILQKSAADLALIQFDEHRTFLIQALTFGLNRIILNGSKGIISIGAQGTVNFTDPDIKLIYGTYPLSAQVFLRFSPPRIDIKHGH